MNTADRRARAALWSIRGVGPVTLVELEALHGPAGGLLEEPVSRWLGSISWRGEAAERLAQWGVLSRVADALEARCRATQQAPIFPGDEAWPPRLVGDGSPPVLFLRGPGAAAPPRRRVAVVGTRTPDLPARDHASRLAAELASLGLGVVSGAAVGIDQAAHRGALAGNGETWAFLGSGLDQIDAAQRAVSREILEGGGSLFSQFPPGCRARPSAFTQRNTSISGASDAVLVHRAPQSSGALYTAAAALEQGRPLLAVPGDPWNEKAAGSNALLGAGARPYVSVKDVLEAVGLVGTLSPLRADPVQVEQGPIAPVSISEAARQVLAALDGLLDFEALEARVGPAAGALSAALVELELAGVVIQHPGRRYEKR